MQVFMHMCMPARVGGCFVSDGGWQQGILVVEGSHNFRKEGTLFSWEIFRTLSASSH